MFLVVSLFICSLISPNQPTPRRLPGLRASPAPPLWSSSHRLCTARRSASPRCIPSHQSALECRWDAHLCAEMQITSSISLNQHELQSSLKHISNNRHHEHSQHVCLCSSAFIFLFCLWFISNACHHYFRHISFFDFIFNRIRVTFVLFWARYVHPSHHFLSSVIFETLVIYLHYLKNVKINVWNNMLRNVERMEEICEIYTQYNVKILSKNL